MQNHSEIPDMRQICSLGGGHRIDESLSDVAAWRNRISCRGSGVR